MEEKRQTNDKNGKQLYLLVFLDSSICICSHVSVTNVLSMLISEDECCIRCRKTVHILYQS